MEEYNLSEILKIRSALELLLSQHGKVLKKVKPMPTEYIPNLWEGEAGLMEHVHVGFPEPKKASFLNDCIIDSNNEQERYDFIDTEEAIVTEEDIMISTTFDDKSEKEQCVNSRSSKNNRKIDLKINEEDSLRQVSGTEDPILPKVKDIINTSQPVTALRKSTDNEVQNEKIVSVDSQQSQALQNDLGGKSHETSKYNTACDDNNSHLQEPNNLSMAKTLLQSEDAVCLNKLDYYSEPHILGVDDAVDMSDHTINVSKEKLCVLKLRLPDYQPLMLKMFKVKKKLNFATKVLKGKRIEHKLLRIIQSQFKNIKLNFGKISCHENLFSQSDKNELKDFQKLKQHFYNLEDQYKKVLDGVNLLKSNKKGIFNNGLDLNEMSTTIPVNTMEMTGKNEVTAMQDDNPSAKKMNAETQHIDKEDLHLDTGVHSKRNSNTMKEKYKKDKIDLLENISEVKSTAEGLDSNFTQQTKKSKNKNKISTENCSTVCKSTVCSKNESKDHKSTADNMKTFKGISSKKPKAGKITDSTPISSVNTKTSDNNVTDVKQNVSSNTKMFKKKTANKTSNENDDVVIESKTVNKKSTVPAVKKSASKHLKARTTNKGSTAEDGLDSPSNMKKFQSAIENVQLNTDNVNVSEITSSSTNLTIKVQKIANESKTTFNITNLKSSTSKKDIIIKSSTELPTADDLNQADSSSNGIHFNLKATKEILHTDDLNQSNFSFANKNVKTKATKEISDTDYLNPSNASSHSKNVKLKTKKEILDTDDLNQSNASSGKKKIKTMTTKDILDSDDLDQSNPSPHRKNVKIKAKKEIDSDDFNKSNSSFANKNVKMKATDITADDEIVKLKLSSSCKKLLKTEENNIEIKLTVNDYKATVHEYSINDSAKIGDKQENAINCKEILPAIKDFSNRLDSSKTVITSRNPKQSSEKDSTKMKQLDLEYQTILQKIKDSNEHLELVIRMTKSHVKETKKLGLELMDKFKSHFQEIDSKKKEINKEMTKGQTLHTCVNENKKQQLRNIKKLERQFETLKDQYHLALGHERYLYPEQNEGKNNGADLTTINTNTSDVSEKSCLITDEKKVLNNTAKMKDEMPIEQAVQASNTVVIENDMQHEKNTLLRPESKHNIQIDGSYLPKRSAEPTEEVSPVKLLSKRKILNNEHTEKKKSSTEEVTESKLTPKTYKLKEVSLNNGATPTKKIKL